MPSISKRLRILKYIAEQSVVSLEDVVDHFNGEISAESARVAMYQMSVGHMKYGHIRCGVWYLNDQKQVDYVLSYYPDMTWMSCNPPVMPQIPHFIELNRIRNIFENSSNLNIDQWVSEAVLKGMPLVERDGFTVSNMPDAMFWRTKQDGTKQKYFLEYERTLKAPARYKDVFMNYARRGDVDDKNVIYICRDELIRNKLLSIELKLAHSRYLDEAGRYFQFVTLAGFYRDFREKYMQQEVSRA